MTAAVALLTVRPAIAADVRGIHDLIVGHVDDLLPRGIDEVAVQAHRFVVAVDDDNRVIGCADLAPLSRSVAEVRSLVVSAEARSEGIGGQLVDALTARARIAGFDRVCAFTHVPGYFVRLGFSIVPHEWIPEKISADCESCALFRRCGQYAMVLPLEPLHEIHEREHSQLIARHA